jgi:predicted MFS family arabinose efflux permease
MPSTYSRKPFIILAAAFLVLFINGGARHAIGLTLKPMVEDMGWVRGDLGFAVAIFQVCTAFAMFLSGRAIDALSPRSVLCGGLFLCCLATLAMAWVTQPWHVLVLFGVFYAIGNGVSGVVPVAVMVSRAYPAGAGAASGIGISGMSVGQFFMIGALSYALATLGWREVFLWAGGAHFVLLPLLFWAIPGGDKSGPAARANLPGLTMKEATRTRRFWILTVVYAICGFDDFFVTTHVVAFALDSGLKPAIAGNLLAIMGVTGLIGVLAAGYWGDRSGPAPATIAAFAARTAVFALVYVDQSPLSVTIFALVFGLTFLMTAPLTVLFVRDAFGVAHLGAIAGLVTMVHHIFGGIGAWLGAAVFDHTGHYDGAFAVACVGSLVALVFTIMLPPKRFSPA